MSLEDLKTWLERPPEEFLAVRYHPWMKLGPTEKHLMESYRLFLVEQLNLKPTEVSSMMKPTVGRVVYYKEKVGDFSDNRAAIIAAVHSDECVTLMVISPSGIPEGKPSITRGDGPGQWDWMPYQKAKAQDGDPNSESAEPRPETPTSGVAQATAK